MKITDKNLCDIWYQALLERDSEYTGVFLVEIIRLLHSKMPLDKWASVPKAIEGIRRELVLFLENEPQNKASNLDCNNLERTIKGWIKKDSILEFAFSEAVLKKIKRP
ncbi:TPA: hypothetical protein MC438_003241 [Enterobacter cloacae]|nr:hypothetical protein [Enterobacter cloacae]